MFKIFKPRKTFQTVVEELVEGLENGTVVLDKNSENPKYQARIHLAATTISDALEKMRTNSLEQVNTIPIAHREKLVAILETRIPLLKSRINDLEQQAIQAIDQDSPVKMLDISAEMTRTVTSSMTELEETAFTDADTKTRVDSWLLIMSSGLVKSLAVSRSILDDLVQQKFHRVG